jgi:hypothetical protein
MRGKTRALEEQVTIDSLLCNCLYYSIHTRRGIITKENIWVNTREQGKILAEHFNDLTVKIKLLVILIMMSTKL